MHPDHAAALERMRAFDALPQAGGHYTLCHYLYNRTKLSVPAAAAILSTAEAGGKITLPPPSSNSSDLAHYVGLLKTAYGTRIDASAAETTLAGAASTALSPRPAGSPAPAAAGWSAAFAATSARPAKTAAPPPSTMAAAIDAAISALKRQP